MKLILVIALLFTSSHCLKWWEDATFYQIYPRSFADSDGDGVGDLRGITSRLQYLKEIGVTATWLSPVFKSPMVDFGYDISNFEEIDPTFGTMEDFDELMTKSKELGVKIILDFVPNHSSDEHEWFQKSVKRVPGYEDFYIWDSGKVVDGKRVPPNNYISVFGGSAWTWNDERQQFYLHQFFEKQPDFNFYNPQVRENLKQILQFWLNKGVSGFRIDAVTHFFEKINSDGSWPDEPRNPMNNDPNSYEYLNHIYLKDQPETIELIYEWRKVLDTYAEEHGGDERVLLSEAYSPIEFLSKLTGNSTHNGSQIPFNFNMINLDHKSNANDIETKVNEWMKTYWKTHGTANWVFGNHDRPRISDRFGAQRVDLVNMLSTTLPGATVQYYGEEIGMHNVQTQCTNISCDYRDGERSPMQWNDGISAGFSTSTNTWLPVADDYKIVNVENQRKNSKSHLNTYKALQNLRRTKAFKNFKDDSWSYGALTKHVFYVKRTSSEEGYLVLLNFGDLIEHCGKVNSFITLGRDIRYHIVTGQSLHYPGEIFDPSSDLYLMPNEGVVLKWVNQ